MGVYTPERRGKVKWGHQFTFIVSCAVQPCFHSAQEMKTLRLSRVHTSSPHLLQKRWEIEVRVAGYRLELQSTDKASLSEEIR